MDKKKTKVIVSKKQSSDVVRQKPSLKQKQKQKQIVKQSVNIRIGDVSSKRKRTSKPKQPVNKPSLISYPQPSYTPLPPVFTQSDRHQLIQDIKRSIPNFRDIDTSNVSTNPISTQTETPQFVDAETQITTIRRPVRTTEPELPPPVEVEVPDVSERAPDLFPFDTPYEEWRKKDLINLAYQISEKNDLGFSKNKLGKRNRDELISIIRGFQ